MNKFDSATFLAALTLAVATPTAFAADTPGATPPGTDTDAVIPGAKAVDEVGGGAIVDPDRALKQGAKNKESTRQPCKKPPPTQAANPSDVPCTDQSDQINPSQRK
jgi:hypothetical protein